jgi:HEAT repeat protein
LICLLLGAAIAAAAPPDHVAGLRAALGEPVRDLAWRDRVVRDWLQAPHGLSELGRALVLREWRDEDVDPDIAAVDRRNRAALQERFQKAARAVLDHGDPLSQEAAADLLAELGVQARTVGSRAGIGSAFGPDLARLTRSPDTRIAAAAARALGRVNPDPDVALPALNELLGGAPASRAAAAHALDDLMAVCSVAVYVRGPTDVPVTREEALGLAQALIPVAGRALHDPNAEVRRCGAEALRRTTVLLRGLIERPCSDAPPGQPAPAGDAGVGPPVLALRAEGSALIGAFGDPDTEVRHLARETIGELANLRLRLREAGGDPMLPEALEGVLLLVAKQVTDPDVETRLAAVGVLETLGPAAAPAVPQLIRAAGDKDRFVRWAAGRTLGGIGQSAGPEAVTALARLLADREVDVRLIAARALERYGPTAAPAVPELIRAALPDGAGEVRLAALRVLERIGSPEATPALAVLETALSDPDARLRQAAARTLGSLGPAALPVTDALERARNDSDAEVQRAAAEALLRVLHP